MYKTNLTLEWSDIQKQFFWINFIKYLPFNTHTNKCWVYNELFASIRVLNIYLLYLALM